MKASELREKSIPELKEFINGTLRSQFKFRLTKSSGELKEPHRIRNYRRLLARALTILAEKQGTNDE